MNDIMLKIENVSKQYKLGQIGGTTLRDELQRLRAKRRGEEDPTRLIGAKQYNKGETFMALDGVSFEVKKGERIGIIGHNGAGKSTLLKLISRVTAPTGGWIGLNGRVASMLEVGTGFHGELTGRENIYMNGAILGMTKKEIDAKMEDIIEFSECRQFIDTPVKRYSSGMYVKLAFSVAAHLDSEIMIMDEVLAVGDMAFQKKCLDKMSDVSKSEGRTILYVSHNMNTIRQLCNRVVVLDHGNAVFDGDTEGGIGLYTGKNMSISTYKDFSKINRVKWARTDKIKIISFDAKRENAIYHIGDKVKANIICDCFKDIHGFQIRLELRDDYDTPISMAMTGCGLSVQSNKTYNIEFTFDTSKVVPGFYYIGILFYLPTGYGSYEDLDAIPDLYSFEIRADEDFNHNIPWRKNLWGNIFSDDVDVHIEEV